MNDPMARRSSSRSSASASGSGCLVRTIVVAILIAAAYWYRDRFPERGTPQAETPAPVPAEVIEPAPVDAPVVTPPPQVAESKKSAPAETKPPKAKSSSNSVTKVNGYDRLEGCVMVDHKDNDGDSFHVRHGNREFELRLYYVDTPEKYLSDRYADQRRRVAEQGRDFGGLSPEQTVEVGKAAKMYTAKLLQGKPFTVFTKWEHVYDSERIYGFVELPGSDEYLSEDLVEKGLGRIHTKGEATPEGQSYRQYKSHLETLERAAKQAGKGAWGLN